MLTVDDIATKCGVDEATAKYWITSKQLAAVNVCKRPGGSKPRWRVTEDDLAAFLAGRGNRPATNQQATTTKTRRKTIPAGKQWI